MKNYYYERIKKLVSDYKATKKKSLKKFILYLRLTFILRDKNYFNFFIDNFEYIEELKDKKYDKDLMI